MCLPLIFNLTSSTIPILGDLMNYILMGSGRWSYDVLSYNNLLFGIGYSVAFMLLIDKLKGIPFWKLIIFAQFLTAFGLGFSIFNIYGMYIGVFWTFILSLFGNTVQSLGSDLLLIPMIGRISKYLPDGFESTGITVIIALQNFTVLGNNQFSASEMEYYGIDKGYYDRTKWPMAWNTGAQVLLMLLAPLFLGWG